MTNIPISNYLISLPDSPSSTASVIGDQQVASTIRTSSARRNEEARREQNRNAQRALRDRKERRAHELECRCRDLETLIQEQRGLNARLQYTISALRAENRRLKPAQIHVEAVSRPPMTIGPLQNMPLFDDHVKSSDIPLFWPLREADQADEHRVEE